MIKLKHRDSFTNYRNVKTEIIKDLFKESSIEILILIKELKITFSNSFHIRNYFMKNKNFDSPFKEDTFFHNYITKNINTLRIGYTYYFNFIEIWCDKMKKVINENKEQLEYIKRSLHYDQALQDEEMVGLIKKLTKTKYKHLYPIEMNDLFLNDFFTIYYINFYDRDHKFALLSLVDKLFNNLDDETILVLSVYKNDNLFVNFSNTLWKELKLKMASYKVFSNINKDKISKFQDIFDVEKKYISKYMRKIYILKSIKEDKINKYKRTYKLSLCYKIILELYTKINKRKIVFDKVLFDYIVFNLHIIKGVLKIWLSKFLSTNDTIVMKDINFINIIKNNHKITGIYKNHTKYINELCKEEINREEKIKNINKAYDEDERSFETIKL